MKKLAARDFEDILQVTDSNINLLCLLCSILLQCCIPCFDGLLPSPHNESVLDLLYILSYWHSLAKLRMHTDSSLQVLKNVTVALGQEIRYFAEETSKHFKTLETDREFAARNRAETRRQARKDATSAASHKAQPDGSRRPAKFNLETPKLHFLGDYESQIRLFGTTDSFTSQIVS